jgi:hypothetical protein
MVLLFSQCTRPHTRPQVTALLKREGDALFDLSGEAQQT